MPNSDKNFQYIIYNTLILHTSPQNPKRYLINIEGKSFTFLGNLLISNIIGGSWGSKFFHFHAVFGKNVKNNSNFGSWRPPRENPGSATEHTCQQECIPVRCVPSMTGISNGSCFGFWGTGRLRVTVFLLCATNSCYVPIFL